MVWAFLFAHTNKVFKTLQDHKKSGFHTTLPIIIGIKHALQSLTHLSARTLIKQPIKDLLTFYYLTKYKNKKR